MKTAAAILLLFSVIFTAVSAITAADASATTEPNDAPPADTGGTDDLTETFLNINIWLFTAALAIFIICTVGIVIYRIKKSISA